MAHIWKDRVLETTTTTGTGALTLAGALTGFRTFASVCSTSDTIYYFLEAVDGAGVPTGDWETGFGTYSGTNTLTRTTVLDSSNSGAAVSFSAGTKRVGSGPLSSVAPTDALVVAVSDETTDLTTGTAKLTFRMPYAFVLTSVRASVGEAPTGAALQVDINEGGVSILSTKLTIDDGEKTSTTAATPAVVSDTALADDAEITIDIDQVGSTNAGAGLKVALIGRRI